MSKINTKHIADDAVTFVKMANDIVVAPPSTTAPTSPAPTVGQLYYNTVDELLYSYDGAAWNAGGGGGDSVITWTNYKPAIMMNRSIPEIATDDDYKATSQNTFGDRIERGAMAIKDNLMYIIGGTGAAGATQNTMTSYDLMTETKTVLATMTVGVKANRAVVWGDNIYCFGGDTGSGYTDAVQIYSISGNSWSAGTVMPANRAYHAVCVLNGIVYLSGGYSSGSTSSKTFYSYNIDGDSWDATLADMPGNKFIHDMVAHKGIVYAVGGRSSGATESTGLYSFTISTETWSSALSSLNYSSSANCCGVYGNHIIAAMNYSDAGYIQVYNIATDTWYRPTINGLYDVSIHAQCYVYHGILHIFGGASSHDGLCKIPIDDLFYLGTYDAGNVIALDVDYWLNDIFIEADTTTTLTEEGVLIVTAFTSDGISGTITLSST